VIVIRDKITRKSNFRVNEGLNLRNSLSRTFLKEALNFRDPIWPKIRVKLKTIESLMVK
jgi:hypothetical protein